MNYGYSDEDEDDGETLVPHTGMFGSLVVAFGFLAALTAAWCLSINSVYMRRREATSSLRLPTNWFFSSIILWKRVLIKLLSSRHISRYEDSSMMMSSTCKQGMSSHRAWFFWWSSVLLCVVYCMVLLAVRNVVVSINLATHRPRGVHKLPLSYGCSSLLTLLCMCLHSLNEFSLCGSVPVVHMGKPALSVHAPYHLTSNRYPPSCRWKWQFNSFTGVMPPPHILSPC